MFLGSLAGVKCDLVTGDGWPKMASHQAHLVKAGNESSHSVPCSAHSCSAQLRFCMVSLTRGSIVVDCGFLKKNKFKNSIDDLSIKNKNVSLYVCSLQSAQSCCFSQYLSVQICDLCGHSPNLDLFNKRYSLCWS